MIVPMVVAVRRRMSMSRRRQVDNLPMAHPSFGDDMIGEFLHVFTRSLQDRTSMQVSWSRWT